MNVFTYGTLMFPDVMKTVVGACSPGEAARAVGLRRTRLKGLIYPAVYECRGAVVEGVLFQEVLETALPRLDYFEGDEYERREVSVELNGAVVSAWCYVLPESNAEMIDARPWEIETFRVRYLADYLQRACVYMREMPESG